MKKILAFIFLTLPAAAFCQVLVSSHPIDLKKAKDYQEAFTATEAANSQFDVFVSDKDTVNALHFNTALFLKDSLKASRPDRAEYPHMVGYSFTNGIPAIYWADEKLEKIAAQYFDFTAGAVTTSAFQPPLADELVLANYSDNNTYTIITLPDSRDELKLYIFTGGKFEVKTLDFSGIAFTDANSNKKSFNNLLLHYGLQVIPPQGFNSLTETSSKIKLYPSAKNLVLTLDNSATATQVLTIDATTYAISQKFIMQAAFNQLADANSFYHEGRLYQLKINENDLALRAVDLAADLSLKEYNSTKADTVSFKNSPLLEQTLNGRTREFKDTKHFLSRADGGIAALSVYRTPNDIMVTAGAVRNVYPAGNVILGSVLGVGMIAMGVGDIGSLAGDGDPQLIYFESLFNDKFEHKALPQQMLATDKIGQFTANNEGLTLQTVTPFNGYYVLGFYNRKLKQYVLFTFTDEAVRF